MFFVYTKFCFNLLNFLKNDNNDGIKKINMMTVLEIELDCDR